MASDLIPPPGSEPYVADSLTPQQSIASWIDLMKACDKLLLAGLRREVGPDADLRAAFREWYKRHMEEHDRMLERMVRRMRASSDGN
jgi:hypothetical protein